MSMMKGFSNAFRIPELRKKILITLGLVFVCRLVSQIPTPGVDWQSLQRIIEEFKSQSAGGGMLDWFEVFTGGALGQCALPLDLALHLGADRDPAPRFGHPRP